MLEPPDCTVVTEHVLEMCNHARVQVELRTRSLVSRNIHRVPLENTVWYANSRIPCWTVFLRKDFVQGFTGDADNLVHLIT